MAPQSDVPAATPCLIELPDGVEDEDWRKYEDPGPYGDEIFTIEDLVEKYPAKPWFRMQLARLLCQRDADARALCHYEKIQNYLGNIGLPRDPVLDAFVDNYRNLFITTTEDIFQESKKQTFYQEWKPTKAFRFPLDLPQFPDGHEIIHRN
ncbi:hypothetical protein BDZ89DRAFT_720115 [Hymenopellis radicata]|nr:hypothetical protein BDZ89DRAFT_720115 [Hymenopellis radicata]